MVCNFRHKEAIEGSPQKKASELIVATMSSHASDSPTAKPVTTVRFPRIWGCFYHSHISAISAMMVLEDGGLVSRCSGLLCRYAERVWKALFDTELIWSQVALKLRAFASEILAGLCFLSTLLCLRCLDFFLSRTEHPSHTGQGTTSSWMPSWTHELRMSCFK